MSEFWWKEECCVVNQRTGTKEESLGGKGRRTCSRQSCRSASATHVATVATSLEMIFSGNQKFANVDWWIQNVKMWRESFCSLPDIHQFVKTGDDMEVHQDSFNRHGASWLMGEYQFCKFSRSIAPINVLIQYPYLCSIICHTSCICDFDVCPLIAITIFQVQRNGLTGHGVCATATAPSFQAFPSIFYLTLTLLTFYTSWTGSLSFLTLLSYHTYHTYFSIF